jgi:hypothetical protein
MLIDWVLWFGLVTVAVVSIFLGCRLVMDFPGLLEGNIVQEFRETKYDKEEPLEEVLVNKERKISTKVHRGSGKGVRRTIPKSSECCSKTGNNMTVSYKPMSGEMAIQLDDCSNEVSIIIKQQQKKEFSIDIDISHSDIDNTHADNDTSVSYTVKELAST